MIPYQDLVAALTNWRIQQGLPVGDADYLGEPRPLEFNLPVAEPTAEDEVQTGEADILSEEFDGADASLDSYEQSYAQDEAVDTAADEEVAAAFENLGTGDYEEEVVAQQAAAADPDIDIHDEPTAYGVDQDFAEAEVPMDEEEDTAFATLENLDNDSEPGINETQELSIEDAEEASEPGFAEIEEEATAMSSFDPEDDPEK